MASNERIGEVEPIGSGNYEFPALDAQHRMKIAGDVTVTVPPATDFTTFGQNVGIAALLVDITTPLPDAKYAIIQADIDNTEPVYIGKATVTITGATRGTQLIAGQSTTYPISSGLYVIGPDALQKIIVTAFNGST